MTLPQNQNYKKTRHYPDPCKMVQNCHRFYPFFPYINFSSRSRSHGKPNTRSAHGFLITSKSLNVSSLPASSLSFPLYRKDKSRQSIVPNELFTFLFL